MGLGLGINLDFGVILGLDIYLYHSVGSGFGLNLGQYLNFIFELPVYEERG